MNKDKIIKYLVEALYCFGGEHNDLLFRKIDGKIRKSVSLRRLIQQVKDR